MANWQRTIDISASWKLAKEYEISYQELAKEILHKLNTLKPFDNEDVEYVKSMLIEEFEILADDEDEDEGWFNYTMEKLYDWGDTKLDNDFGGKKVCWIKTF